MASEPLLPCPFCGRKVDFATDEHGHQMVHCDWCWASMSSDGPIADLTADWNERAAEGWVACAERMPDGDYQYALVYAPCQVAFGCTYGPIIDKAMWDADENRWSTGWGQRLTITHWRPLPAPPPAAEITAEKTEGTTP